MTAQRPHRGLLRVAPVVVTAAVCAVLAQFRDDVTASTAVLVLVVVVVGFAATGDRASTMISAVAAAAWFDFFLTAPYGSFAIDEPADLEAALLLAAVGLAVTEITLLGRRAQARASRREGYLDGVFRVSTLATAGRRSTEDLTGLAAREINEVLGIDGCRYVAAPDVDARTPHLDHDGEVTSFGRRIDVRREGLPVDDEIALAVRRGGVTIGHFMLTASTRVVRPSLEQRRVAVLLADQVGAARPLVRPAR